MRASLYSRTALSAVLFTVAGTVMAAPGDASPATPATPAANTPATTPATNTPAPTPPPPVAAVQTQRIDFSNSLRDIYSQYDWMVIQVDFVVRNNLDPDSNPRWASNVDITMTIGWGVKSATAPQVDVAMTSTLKLVGAEVGRVSTAFFFVPPEVLQRGTKRVPLNARSIPSFYVVQYSINGQPVKISRGDVSSSLPDAPWWDGFLEVAKGKMAFYGTFMNESDVPPYVLTATLARVSPGNAVPTFVRPRG